MRLEIIKFEKELKQIKEKFENLEVEKKLKEDIEKYFHHVLRETNNRLNKENKKFLYLLGSVENLKERYENENKRYLEQYHLIQLSE